MQPRNLTAGQTVGRYRIVSLIGEGGMGRVYLAEDTKLHRRVSLKFLSTNLTEDQQRLRRFEQEARAASALNHPNIITIHEIGEEDGHQFIGTEFIEGQTLRERLRSPLDLAESLEIAIQVASALVAAHRVNIIHRDIKPENIMIRQDDGLVKVLDFGLAKITVPERAAIDAEADTQLRNTAPGVVMGTVAYMSPEQARGETVDERTDIWSLGVVIYEMIAGYSPFVANTSNEILSTILSKTPAPPLARFVHDVPERLEEIVEKALTKNKDERYQTSKDLLIDLKRLQQSLQLKAASERSKSPDRIIPATADGQANVARSETTPPVTQTASSANYIVNQVRSHKRTIVVLALLLVSIATAAFIYRTRLKATGSTPQVKSLVVLPFKNLSGKPEDEYLSDGIADDLIAKLTKLKSIRIVSLSVAMRYKGSSRDAVEIGRELGVDAVLDGTVRKVGDRFRVNVHLVNVSDGFEMWADDGFESNIQNLLDAERQLAEIITTKLKGELTPQDRLLVARTGTANAEAYELLLRGKELLRKSEWETARQLFDRAIQLDPNFADAYAWLAFAYGGQFEQGESDRRALDAAFANANKALSIDPNLIVAHRALITFYRNDSQTEKGLKQAKLALTINPDDQDAIKAAGHAYFETGMVDRSIEYYKRALAADPADDSLRSRLARGYLHMHEYQKGLDVLAPSLNRRQGGYWMAMVIYGRLKQYDKAAEMYELLRAESPSFIVGCLDYGQLLKEEGKPDRAREVWLEGVQVGQTLAAKAENVRTHIWLGHLYAELEERDKALEHVKRALIVDPRNAWVLHMSGEINAKLGNKRLAVSYLKEAVEHGWLEAQYYKEMDKLLGDDAEYRDVRDALEKRVIDLRTQYQ